MDKNTLRHIRSNTHMRVPYNILAFVPDKKGSVHEIFGALVACVYSPLLLKQDPSELKSTPWYKRFFRNITLSSML